MKKRNLLLLGLVLATLIFPLVFASTENSITILLGNSSNSSDMFFALTTVQITTNPEIDTNITY